MDLTGAASFSANGTAAKADSAAAGVRAGQLPVYVGKSSAAPQQRSSASSSQGLSAATTDPTKVRVQLMDRASTDAARVRGVLLRVGRADGATASGRVNMSVDYGAFANVYGADWSTRLRLTVLPNCALTTPDLPECAGAVVPSHNDVVTHRVSADVVLPGAAKASAATDSASAASAAAAGTVVALTAGASGSAGGYAATSLSPSSTWSAGGNSGDFAWSYPMRSPPALGGPAPTWAGVFVAVGGRPDGRVEQPARPGRVRVSRLATGGYIERRYKACADDMESARQQHRQDR